MRKLGLSLLILIAAFAFCSAKAYASDCAAPTMFNCNCGLQHRTGFELANGGGYFPSDQAICCGQVVPGIYTTGSGTCFDAANITEVMRKELAHLALHNRVFLVACNGDLIPFWDSAAPEQAPEPTWSADRAISAYEGKLATRTR